MQPGTPFTFRPFASRRRNHSAARAPSRRGPVRTIPSAERLEVRVLLSAGDPDPRFAGGAARLTTDFGGDDGVRAMAVLADGRILAAGRTTWHSPSGDLLSDVALA